MNDNVNTTQEDVVRTILIADDDEDILALVHRALSESGYEVLLARDGATALTTARDAETRAGFARHRNAGAGRVRGDLRTEE